MQCGAKEIRSVSLYIVSRIFSLNIDENSRRAPKVFMRGSRRSAIMPGVKPDPSNSSQGHDELELNLARVGACADQDCELVKSHSIANQRREYEAKSLTLRQHSGVSTRLKVTVKNEFETYDSHLEESCSMSGQQTPNDSCSGADRKALVSVRTNDDIWTSGRADRERSFSCELCRDVFNSSDLTKHSLAHIDRPLLTCERCSVSSDDVHSGRHREQHRVKQLQKCDICQEEFDEYNVRVHTDVHINESSCCGRSQEPVVNVQTLNAFARQPVSGASHDEDPSTTRHICHLCAQAFDYETDPSEHVRVEHSGELSTSNSQDKKPSINQSILVSVDSSADAGELVHESPSATDYSPVRSFEDKVDKTPVQKVEPCPGSFTMETASSALEEVRHACHLCPEEFDDDSKLHRHIRAKHGRNKKRFSGKAACAEKRFACQHCSKRFQQKGHLTRHLVTHTGKVPFHCHLCPAMFSQKGVLQRHVHRHIGYKRFQCSLCPMKFVVKADMETHRRTHTGERPFACDRCPASFSARDNLKKHINSHIGARPHACQKCPRSFTRLTDLKRHDRRHTGERPYSCTSCSKTFTRGHLLRDHLVATHYCA